MHLHLVLRNGGCCAGSEVKPSDGNNKTSSNEPTSSSSSQSKDTSSGGGGRSTSSGSGGGKSRRSNSQTDHQSHRRTSCPHCKETFSKKEQLEAHTTLCGERKVTCHHVWCDEVVKNKDLESHMDQCAKSRRTKCAKCGETIAVLDLANHRSQCVTVQCKHCAEQVIPRIMKYCPYQLFRNVHYTKGPFASDYLFWRFMIDGGVNSHQEHVPSSSSFSSSSSLTAPGFGLHEPVSPVSPRVASSTAVKAYLQYRLTKQLEQAGQETPVKSPNALLEKGFPTSSEANVLAGGMNNNNNDSPGAGGNTPSVQSLRSSSPSITVRPPAAPPAEIDVETILEPAKKSEAINYYVARVQHLWRWARARVLLEDVVFKLIYKEIDTKKESFSIFKTRQKYFELDSEGKVVVLKRQNSPTAAPVATQGPVKDHYFPISVKTQVTPDLLDRVLQDIAAGIQIPYFAVYRVFNETADKLKVYSNVQKVPSLEGARYVAGRWVQGGKANVVGDLHGQIADLLKILDMNGKPSEGNIYVFNGDFVDRGSKGFEVFFVLCMLFLAYPGKVFLNRGNHECHYMNEEYGFDVEVQTKYDRNVFKLVQRCFIHLPLATLIGKKVFVVHAGVPRMSYVTLADIDAIDRLRQIPLPAHDQSEEDEIFQDLLWSDPMEKRGWLHSERGVGVLYGPDISRAFMETNGLSLIIRSHETFQRGYEEHHGGRVITIFSASNYDGPETNSGAVLQLVAGSAEPSYHTYQVTPEEYEGAQAQMMLEGTMTASATSAAGGMGSFEGGGMQRTFSLFSAGPHQTLGNVFWFTGLLHNKNRAAREDVLRSIRESLYERRHKLLAYFSKIDRTRKGTVWKMEWTEAMHNVLNLNVPWFFLRPYLCETEPETQRINYVKFLKRFSTAMSKCYMEDWELTASADLYAHTRGRKNHEIVRQLTAQTSLNYNTFCSIFRRIDNNLSDNALFELFVHFDEDNEGCFSGSRYYEFLETVADDVEASYREREESSARSSSSRKNSQHRQHEGEGEHSDYENHHAGNNNNNSNNNNDVRSPGSDASGSSASSYNHLDLSWDLDALNELEHIIYTSRSSLHTLFKLPSRESLIDRDVFVTGCEHLVHAVKKLNAISSDNIERLWCWLTEQSNRDELSIDELYLCFSVRDFVLLSDRNNWLGVHDGAIEQGDVSVFYLMTWLTDPHSGSSSVGSPINNMSSLTGTQLQPFNNPSPNSTSSTSGSVSTPSRPPSGRNSQIDVSSS